MTDVFLFSLEYERITVILEENRDCSQSTDTSPIFEVKQISITAREMQKREDFVDVAVVAAEARKSWVSSRGWAISLADRSRHRLRCSFNLDLSSLFTISLIYISKSIQMVWRFHLAVKLLQSKLEQNRIKFSKVSRYILQNIRDYRNITRSPFFWVKSRLLNGCYIISTRIPSGNHIFLLCLLFLFVFTDSKSNFESKNCRWFLWTDIITAASFLFFRLLSQ